MHLDKKQDQGWNCETQRKKKSNINKEKAKKFLENLIKDLNAITSLEDFDFKAGDELYELTTRIEEMLKICGVSFQYLLDMHPKIALTLREKFKIVISIYQKGEKKWDTIRHFTEKKND